MSRVTPVNDLHFPRQYVSAPCLVDRSFDSLQPRLQVHRVGGKCPDGEGRPLVEILAIRFHHKDLMTVSNAIHELSGMAAFLFEAPCIGYVHREGGDADIDILHARTNSQILGLFGLLRRLNPESYSSGATSTILKASMTSPTLMSWYLSSPIPQSNPCRTSAASSLNRRREES